MTAGLIFYGQENRRFIGVYDGPWKDEHAFTDAILAANAQLTRERVAPYVAVQKSDKFPAALFTVQTSDDGVPNEDLKLVQAVIAAARTTRTLADRVHDFFEL